MEGVQQEPEELLGIMLLIPVVRNKGKGNREQGTGNREQGKREKRKEKRASGLEKISNQDESN